MAIVAGQFECQQCGEQFERDQTRLYLYCSRACYHQSRIGRRQNRTPKAPKQRKMIIRTCAWCTTQFHTLSSAGARARFCSRSCQAYFHANQTPAQSLASTEAAYLAAIVDGEGSVSIIDRSATRPGASRPTIRLVVGNTYLPLLEWIAAKTGVGRIFQHSKLRDRVKPNKQMYYWGVTSLQAVQVLQQLTPYLLEKRERAQPAIDSQPNALRDNYAARRNASMRTTLPLNTPEITSPCGP